LNHFMIFRDLGSLEIFSHNHDCVIIAFVVCQVFKEPPRELLQDFSFEANPSEFADICR
jgi:hypothetical protein